VSRELGVSSYKGDVTEEASEPLLIELTQDSWGMGRIRHLCRRWHGASLDVGRRGQGESQRLGRGQGPETREMNCEGARGCWSESGVSRAPVAHAYKPSYLES
jgi:hypothetical protein